MRPLPVLVTTALISLASLPVPGSAGPVAGKAEPTTGGDGREVHTVMIHGLRPQGVATSDCTTWSDMTRALVSFGHEHDTLHTVKYYGHEDNCRDDIHDHGSHAAHHPSGHAYSNHGHSQDASIRHLGYHLAWFLNDEFAESDRPVQVVAVSMGGLIIRYALSQIERGHPDFPTDVEVEDVVTLGSPHDGSALVRLCREAQQCREMRPSSELMDELNIYATHPDGRGGTDWTTIGSRSDDLVDPSSAVHMDADHKVTYMSRNGVEHGDYYRTTSRLRTADVEWFDLGGGGWREWYQAPWPVRWTDLALRHSSW